MAYEALDPNAKPLLYVYIIVAVLATIMTILMLLRWRERKKNKFIFNHFFSPLNVKILRNLICINVCIFLISGRI